MTWIHLPTLVLLVVFGFMWFTLGLLVGSGDVKDGEGWIGIVMLFGIFWFGFLLHTVIVEGGV